ncbi:hypothetical protein [Argonema galeatum]|uniref:hypothetical protein n=1 Tax=Argonema galeatum TaxID=2942762 RepID=UPI002011F093|nr:hypothetical protein [Argonema galeatum]MCL1465460.1 hypothetical protein [Argonema galeatum A003/A1]
MNTQGQRNFVKLAFYLTVMLLLSANSCDSSGVNANVKVKVEHLDEAIKTLDTAINTLGNESGRWRETLKDLEDKIADDVQSTIKVEIANLITHGVAVVGK